MSSSATAEFGLAPPWPHRHLLGIEQLSAAEIALVLDTADRFRRAATGADRRVPLLTGKTCANLFFENSTRTRNSFTLAARRLGADTLDFSAGNSSLSKGETVVDTARNIEAMGVDAMVVRHATPGTPHVLARRVRGRAERRRRRRTNTPRRRCSIC